MRSVLLIFFDDEYRIEMLSAAIAKGERTNARYSWTSLKSHKKNAETWERLVQSSKLSLRRFKTNSREWRLRI